MTDDSTTQAAVAGAAGVAASTATLLDRLGALDEDGARGPALVPGWTRAHLLAHLARHADALVRVTQGAQRGEIVDPYPDGAAGRARGIEEGVGVPAAELVADLRTSTDELAALWAAVPAELWHAPTRSSTGSRPLGASVTSRWIEVEVHHGDLGLGYGPSDWSEDFNAVAAAYVISGLPARWKPKEPGHAGSWLVRMKDPAAAYFIDLVTQDEGHPAPTVTPWPFDDEAPEPTHVVEGSAADVVAWLLGRSYAVAPSVVRPGPGGVEAALGLPSVCPFP